MPLGVQFSPQAPRAVAPSVASEDLHHSLLPGRWGLASSLPPRV